MALPSSGTISASAINVELTRSATAQISLASAATGGYVTINTASPSRPNASTPHAMSEWYSYDHTYGAAQGECYTVFAGSSTTVHWKDVTGTNRSDSLGAFETVYLCSTITPYEDFAADLVVTPSGTPCSNTHTSVAGATSDPCYP